MKNEKMKSILDVHICNYVRENGEGCGTLGAKQLTDDLKKWAKEETNGEIKVFRGGCQSNCAKGISMALYPERNFLVEVKVSDKEEIKEGLIEALKLTKN
jgi:predicted metal-binding protein